MKYIYHVIRHLMGPIIWAIRNRIKKTDVRDYRTSLSISMQPFSSIRRGSEVGPYVTLGDFSYISGPDAYCEEAVIGKYCSIARGTTIGVSDHNYNWVTTHPVICSKCYGITANDVLEPQKNSPIIGNDVWIGMNSTIMRGVIVGDGSVVAANSVVTKNIDPYSIVAGNPAKVIKMRFNENVIRKLLVIKWWDWPYSLIAERVKDFYDIEAFVEKYYTDESRL